MATLLLAKNLRELRESHNYTQKNVSAYLNIERPTYSNYELGKRTPPLELLIALAELYNVSVDYLLRNNKTRDHNTEKVAYRPITLTDETLLLTRYRALSEPAKAEVLDFLKLKIRYAEHY